MEEFWDKNMAALKNADLQLYRRIKAYSPQITGEVVETSTVPTMRFEASHVMFMYDPVDPIRQIETTLPILQNKNDLSRTVCIFTGLGLGYIQLIALDRRKDIFRLVILEPSLDIFCAALKYVDLTPLILSEKVYIMAGDIDWDDYYDILSKKNLETDFLFSDFTFLFELQPELYKTTRQMAGTYAERAVAGLTVLKEYGQQLFINRIENLKLFRDSSPVDVLKDAFKQKPAILVSAGPSLGKSIDALKKAVGKCVIIALDSAVVPLQKHGVVPDFVTTLDYQFLNSEKLAPDLIQSADFYLVSGIVANHLTPKRLNIKHLFFSFQDNDAQDWILEGMGATHRMAPVGSVALLSLTLAQMIEADPVILVGHDFALTEKEIDHAEGAVLGGIYLNKETFSVEGVDGNLVPTNNTFFEFKTNFEALLANNNRNYINATASGAFIRGTVVQPLEEVLDQSLKTNIPVKEIVDECLKDWQHKEPTYFIQSAHKAITHAKKSLTHVNKILNETNKVRTELQKKRDKLARINEFSDLPGSIQSAKRKIYKFYTRYVPFLPMEELSAEKNMEVNSLIAEQEGHLPYIDSVCRENLLVDKRMKAHKFGLQSFVQLVEGLVSFLKQEGKLLTDLKGNPTGEKELFALGEFYLESELFFKSHGVLTRFVSSFPESSLIGRAQMLLGTAAAQCLDFKNANVFWEKAIYNDLSTKETIDEVRKKMAADWLKFDGKVGATTIPENTIKRAFTLCSSKDIWHELEDEVWGWYYAKFNYYVKTFQFDKLKSLLGMCQPVSKKRAEWFYLMARAIRGDTRDSDLKITSDEMNDALKFMKRALDENSQNAKWIAFLSRLYLESGDNDNGIGQLVRAVKLDPKQAVLWEELGDVLFQNEDFPSAVIAYEHCFIALPEMIDVLRKIGDCYFKQNLFDAAKSAYDTVLKKDGNNDRAREQLGQLHKLGY